MQKELLSLFLFGVVLEPLQTSDSFDENDDNSLEKPQSSEYVESEGKGKPSAKPAPLAPKEDDEGFFPLSPPPCPPNKYSEDSHQIFFNQCYIPGFGLGKNQQGRIYLLTTQGFKPSSFH